MKESSFEVAHRKIHTTPTDESYLEYMEELRRKDEAEYRTPSEAEFEQPVMSRRQDRMISLGDLYKIVEQPKTSIKTQISEILRNSLVEKSAEEAPRSRKEAAKPRTKGRKKLSLTENEMRKFRECFE